MEIGHQMYSRVAQGVYRSYECYNGWILDEANNLCYIQSPGGATNWNAAVACCSAIGAEILSYQLLPTVQTLYPSLASRVWTDIHYDGSNWVDKNNANGIFSWDGGSAPSPVTFNCATADTVFYETDCTLDYEYFCQSSVPIVSNIDFHDQRGSSLFIASNPSDEFGPSNTGKVDVFWTRTENSVFDNIWDTTPPTNSFTLYGYNAHEGFGASVSYLQDHVIDNQLFVGAVASYTAPSGCTPSSTLNNGKVYVYHGEYTKWTATQILLPPQQFYEQSYFGAHIDSDKAYLHTLIVGCTGCNYTTNNGAIFVYEATPSGSSWSQFQVLTPAFGYSNLAADRVRIHDKLILGDADNRALVWRLLPHLNSAESLDEMEHHKASRNLQAIPARWSHQQALRLPQSYTLSSFDVFDDTIVLGSTLVPFNAHTNVGAVYVLYPSSADFGFHSKKPQPMQWTINQVLIPPSPATNMYFGKDISIAADNMYILSGNQVGYLYARPSRAGYWSLQQAIIHGATAIGAVLEGSTIYSLVNDLTHALEVHDQSNNWNCLLVSVEDQFGDGWDNARLTVTTPEDPKKDEFHPTCDLPNPFQFRYCPSMPRPGVYSFSIPDAVKSKYHWEILWRVFIESSGEWIVGKWDTIMDFEWDFVQLGFRTVKVRHSLPTNVTCQPCHTRPTMKPTPLHRYLKGGTPHPTISPAPTLPTTSGTVWQYLLVDGGADDWFVPDHKSTSYYISDAEGRRLLAVGTLCPSDLATTKLCWEDLPDGEYVLRVGGALNTFKGSHTIKWCKAANPISAQSQVVVRIADHDCQFLSYFSREDYCGITLDYDVVVEFELFIMGVQKEIASAEASVLTSALNSVFHGFVSCNVISAVPLNSGLHVTLHAKFNRIASGYDLADPATLTSLESQMIQSFIDNQRVIWTSLLSGEIKTELHHATGVNFISLHFIGTDHEPVSPTLIADEVVTYEPIEPVEEVKSAPYFLSMSGVLIVGFTAFLALMMVVARFRRQQQQDESLHDVSESTKEESGDKIAFLSYLSHLSFVGPLISSKKHSSAADPPTTPTSKSSKKKMSTKSSSGIKTKKSKLSESQRDIMETC